MHQLPFRCQLLESIIIHICNYVLQRRCSVKQAMPMMEDMSPSYTRQSVSKGGGVDELTLALVSAHSSTCTSSLQPSLRVTRPPTPRVPTPREQRAVGAVLTVTERAPVC
ncbi:hypothetical protein RRG08_023792 [Elysia crispata]|uniref:Uncharacterized protein n=1 Tax=Elysia crispata TaxID=231223 RepID=A0AAE0ZW03_9GAST|nr:hypothetical protein RRG08_023792 [Elysia crispata]